MSLRPDADHFVTIRYSSGSIEGSIKEIMLNLDRTSRFAKPLSRTAGATIVSFVLMVLSIRPITLVLVLTAIWFAFFLILNLVYEWALGLGDKWLS